VRKLTKPGAVAVLVAALLLAGCFGKTPDQYLASAKTLMAKNDNGGAIIQLKNALDKDSGLLEARVLLGKAMIATGDLGGAEVELKKAADAAYPGDELPTLRAQLLLRRGELDKLVTEFGQVKLRTPAAMADLQATLATAYGVLGRNADAAGAADLALQLDADNVHAQLVKVRLAAAAQGLAPASAQLAGILARHPESSEAWQLKGELLQRSGAADPQPALAAFREATVRDKRNLTAHMELLVALLQSRRFGEVQKALDAFKAVAPSNYALKLLTVDYNLEIGQLQRAHDQVLSLLKVAPEDPSTLYVAGATEYRRGSLLQAEDYLGKALPRMQNPEMARLLLARVYLRTGDSAKAVAVLRPLLEAPRPGAVAYSLTAQAQLQAGDVVAADTNFAKAAALDPTDSKSRTALALSQISRGQDAQGFEALHALSASDQGSVADLALISAYWRKGQLDQALKAVDTLDHKQPGGPVAPTLRGRIESSRGNEVQARAAFEAALKVDPAFYPATAALAQMDVDDRNVGAAVKRYETLLKADPTNLRALMAVIALHQLAGAKPAALMGELAALIQANPLAVAPRAELVRMQLRQAVAKEKVLATAQDAVAAIPDNPELFDLLGQVYAAVGDPNQAETAYAKMMSLEPGSPEPFMRVAELCAKRSDRSGAKLNLKRALAVKADYAPAATALFALEVAGNEAAEARSLVAGLEKAPETAALGALLEGDLAAHEKNWTKAADAYRASLDRGAGLAAAVKLRAALEVGGKPAEAAAFEAGWLKAHPNDGAFLSAMGDQAIGRSDYPGALARYQEVLRLNPDEPIVNNNVAWLLNSLKKPGALGYVERAKRLQPDNPVFLDTEATILADGGNLDKAIEVEKQAVALNANLYANRLHLAQYYAKAGQKDAARKELDALAALGAKFGAQADVKKLMATL